LAFSAASFRRCKGHFVAAQVDALLPFELSGQVIDESQVEILAAQMGVAVGGLDFKHPVADLHDGNVEGAAAQIEHGDLLFLFLVQTIGQRCGSGFVDNALDIQSGNPAGILGGLSLAVVEVGRDGNHRIGDRLAQVCLG
jgi:hypothetical protein